MLFYLCIGCILWRCVGVVLCIGCILWRCVGVVLFIYRMYTLEVCWCCFIYV